MQQGKLTGISPLGTGFIEVADGRVVGFHHSMLGAAVTREQWPQLEGRPVVFDLVNGTARHVCFAAAKSAR